MPAHPGSLLQIKKQLGEPRLKGADRQRKQLASVLSDGPNGTL
jgi:hypothetical protein